MQTSGLFRNNCNEDGSPKHYGRGFLVNVSWLANLIVRVREWTMDDEDESRADND